jgi:hypothetical protein
MEFKFFEVNMNQMRNRITEAGFDMAFLDQSIPGRLIPCSGNDGTLLGLQ